MATLVKQLPLLFLLLLAFSASQAIHARESQFFSKTSREEPKEAAAPSKGDAPAATKKEDAPALPPQSHNGHGLYGRGPYRFSPTTTSSYGTYNYNGGARGNRHSTFQSGVPAGTELGGEEKFENGEEYHAVYNYGTRWKPDNNRPSSFSNEYETPTTTTTTTTTLPEWKGETDPTKQYGMSDTRFVENGKYFYDVNAEGKQYAQRSYQWRGNPEGYEPYTGARTGGYGDRRHGSWRGGYGHSNAGEEYQGSQEDYVP